MDNKVNTRVYMITTDHSAFDDRIFYKEAQSLKKAGYDVTVIGRTDSNINKVVNGIRIIGMKKIGPRPLGEMLLILKLLINSIKVRGDIYHCHEPESLLVAIFLKIFMHKKIIHDVREFYLEKELVTFENPLNRILFYILRFFDGLINRYFVDYLFFVEEPKMKKFLEYGINKEKMTVLESYVRTDLFKPSYKTYTKNNFVVGYAGGLSAERGTDKIIDAAILFAKKKNIKINVLLLGKYGNKDDEKLLLEKVRQNKELINLDMDWVDHGKVPIFLKEADICFSLFYSKRYWKVLSGKAGPIKLYEYMALEKPIIAVDLPALQAVREHNCGIIIGLEGDISEIAKAIDFYYTNPEKIEEHGRNGRIAAEKYYNWKICEHKLLNVYKMLCGEK